MIRNMKRHKLEEVGEDMQWSMWQAEQLKALEKYRKNNQEKFGGKFKKLNSKIEGLIRVARDEGNMHQEIAILEAIKKGFPAKRLSRGATAEFFRVNDRKLNALIEATTHDMEKAETAVLRMANDQYRKVIYNAQVYANTGAGTYEKAVDMTTKDFLSAGLNCVQYANGARHTLADYADMAIRTASKRAYLQGEGEKRQEWGIHTVIMNKRGNPCPLCLPFVGKILIDDVWSGGTVKEAAETGHKLMSSAISAGLYHPRCRDSHTTYFDGISTPPDDKYTKKELASIEQNAKQETKQQYAERQEKRFGRLTKYSLDEENQKKYGVKEKVWKDITRSTKSDVIESDLGRFKERLRNDGNIDKQYYSTLKEKFSHGPEYAKRAFTKFVPNDSIERPNFEGVAKFSTRTKRISMHYGMDSKNPRGAGVTWFHEHGHLIDNAAGNISNDKEFLALLKEDSYNYRQKYGKAHGLKTWDKVDAAISKELSNMREHSAVSDIFEGVTKKNVHGVAGHPDGYWDADGSITSEAFAHMFEAQFDEVRLEEMKKYFPGSLKYFEKKLKEVSG